VKHKRYRRRTWRVREKQYRFSNRQGRALAQSAGPQWKGVEGETTGGKDMSVAQERYVDVKAAVDAFRKELEAAGAAPGDIFWAFAQCIRDEIAEEAKADAPRGPKSARIWADEVVEYVREVLDGDTGAGPFFNKSE
jgi:hypothetical protein